MYGLHTLGNYIYFKEEATGELLRICIASIFCKFLHSVSQSEPRALSSSSYVHHQAGHVLVSIWDVLATSVVAVEAGVAEQLVGEVMLMTVVAVALIAAIWVLANFLCSRCHNV